MAKYDIFVGNKIYEWTIISVGADTCTCKCSCGVIREVNINNLSNGLSKSCGHTRRNDLTGQQFGEWTVLEYAGRRDRKSFYLCQCSCGKQKEIRSYDLTHGITKSCGHRLIEARNSLIGKKFGDWEVLKIINPATVLCRCSCGLEKEVNLYSLKSGISRSCGHDNNKNTFSIGDTVDDLTIIGKTENKWRCQCKCGAEVNVSTYELHKHGHKCTGKHKTPFRDLTGQQFGEWTALEYLGHSTWKCRCSCGTIDTRNSYLLVSGATKHCSSEIHTNTKMINLVGQKFGKLTVVKYSKPYWICKCDCGNIVNVLSQNLRNGSTTSCGCSRLLFSKEDILEAIYKFDEKPFICELADSLNVHESTIRNYINRYNLHSYIDKSYRSRYEKDIVSYLKDNNIGDIITSDRTAIAPQELDIYIPERHLAIEFNGNYWHSEETKNRYYHQEKTIACARKGIQLIHIFEYEWIDKHDIILALLDNKLNIGIRRIYARNTIIREVGTNDVKEFISNNHIQGYAPASVNIGCYYKDQLIGVMTFGKPRFNNNYEYELIRYCWSRHTRTIGGAEKIFKYFIDTYNPASIVTYCDISKFTGNVYTKLGFKTSEKHITQPGYVWYDHSNNTILTRYKTQKAHLVEIGLGKYGDTEDEIMYNLGYYKIYNSGNIVMEWRKSNEIYS